MFVVLFYHKACEFFFINCSINPLRWKVSLGRQSLQGPNPNEVSRNVAAIVLHPNYDRVTSDNDVALLRLSSPVRFTDYIRPVCLAASGSVFNSGTKSWVTGWGAVREGGESAGFVSVSMRPVICWFMCKLLLIFHPISVLTIPSTSARSGAASSGKQTV